jgi:hypothetical protein
MSVGKIILILGIIMVVIGFFIMKGYRIPLLGKLPGDISINRENFTFYFPITTSILISLILTILFFILRKH